MRAPFSLFPYLEPFVPGDLFPLSSHSSSRYTPRGRVGGVRSRPSLARLSDALGVVAGFPKSRLARFGPRVLFHTSSTGPSGRPHREIGRGGITGGRRKIVPDCGRLECTCMGLVRGGQFRQRCRDWKIHTPRSSTPPRRKRATIILVTTGRQRSWCPRPHAFPWLYTLALQPIIFPHVTGGRHRKLRNTRATYARTDFSTLSRLAPWRIGASQGGALHAEEDAFFAATDLQGDEGRLIPRAREA